MAYIIGREKETQELLNHYYSSNAEFVAVYGRRRVGKTLLTYTNYCCTIP
jgi:AAA+ ATPase superfamily predicted ATPase